MVHVMIDLETMGVQPDAPIIAVGAVAFTLRDKPHIIEGGHADLHINVDLESAVQDGATPEPATIKWWMEQSGAARETLRANPLPMYKALDAIDSYFCTLRAVHAEGIEGVWGNGAGFDNVILRRTYTRAYRDAPWPFWLDRCYRTAKALALASGYTEPERDHGTKHNAFDDALWQAEQLCAMFDR